MTFLIFYGSYSTTRLGERLIPYLSHHLDGHDIDIIDAAQWDLPFLQKMYQQYKLGSDGSFEDETHKKLSVLSQKIRSADGYIVLTGEYHHNLQPGLTNLMDHFWPEYCYKPSAIVSYSVGPFCGLRAGVQARSYLSALQTSTIPTALAVGPIEAKIDQQGKGLDDKLNQTTGRFIKEFLWYAKALKQGRSDNPVV
jgi:NAD(P)H-dependent FMN reductase